ncbi:hypothetical protein QFZ99_006068 [Paraburkholderia atlantica]
MVTLSLVLLVVAFLLLAAAALMTNVPKVNLMAAGMAIWELAQLIARVGS